MLTSTILAGLCTWHAYTINTPVPPSAVQAGVNFYGDGSRQRDRGIDFAYVVRSQEGTRMAHYRQYSERNFAIGFTWDEPLTSIRMKRYDLRSAKEAEILTCDSRYAHELGWVPYNDSSMIVSNCVHVGVSNMTGEPFLLARAIADDPKVKSRGRVPAIFMPNLGFAITHYSDFVSFTDFELLCLDS